MTSNDDSPEYARLTAGQELLFPKSAWGLCKEIGLDPWAASKLHEDGWLSFDPEGTNSLSEQQECELRFVGSLVTGGLSPRLLPELLKELEEPIGTWLLDSEMTAEAKAINLKLFNDSASGALFCCNRVNEGCEAADSGIFALYR